MPETIAARKQSSPTRLIELDILRGFLLLWMTLTHLPTKASVISNQTFGFVSGAEGFIFLAGFMIGQLEHRIELKRGLAAAARDVRKRLFRVYAYHIGLITIAFTVVAEIAVRFHRIALQNLLSYYLADPKHAVPAAVLLRYRPSLFDILPMYVIFLAATLLARKVARRWGWDLIVYLSFALWAAAQFGLRHWVYEHISLFGAAVPENSIGAFDMYAWQLLWMVGLALGSIYSDQLAGETQPAGASKKHTLPRRLVILATCVAAVFLVLRYSPIDQWTSQQSYAWLIDKWHLGPARVINFAALTIFFVRFGEHIAALPIFQPLALLGRASIEVFSVHILCCMAGDAISPAADPNLLWSQQIPLLVTSISLLFVTAYFAGKWSAHRKARRQLAAVH